MTPYEEIVVLAQEAQLAIAASNPASAVAAYSKSLKLAKPLSRPRLLSVLMSWQGNVLESLGEIQDAVFAYESALIVLTKENFHLGDIVNKLSAVRKGFYGSPEPLPDLYSPEISKNIDAAIADPALVIKLCINIGNVYFRQPQEDPAFNAYQQALNHSDIDQYPLLKAYVKANLGEIFRRRDDLEQAESALTESLDLFKAENESLKSRRAIALLAGIKRDHAQLSQAIELYEQSITLYEQTQDKKGHARTLAGFARLYLTKKDLTQKDPTQKDFDRAEALYSEAQKLLNQLSDDDTSWHVSWGLGCCRYQSGDFLKAIDHFTKSIRLIDRRQAVLRTDEGKVTFLDSVKDVFDQLLLAWLSLAERMENNSADAASAYESALAVAEQARGRALKDMMDGRSRQVRSLSKNAVALANSVDSVPAPPMPNSAAEPFIFDSSMFEQRAISTPVPISELPDNSALNSNTEPLEPIEVTPLSRLVFYVLLDRTAIFAVSPEGAVTGHVSSIGCHALEERVAQLRRALSVDEAARKIIRKATAMEDPLITPAAPQLTLDQQLRSLYADLIDPVASTLPQDGETLIIEPHNVLWLVPFAALKTPAGEWMCDRWPLIYTPSQATLTEIRQEPPYATKDETKAVIVGNPAMPSPETLEALGLWLDPLPGSQKEAEAIHDVFDPAASTLLIGPDATESRVKELSQTHNIVHLATHGIAYTSDPLASFVAFSPTEQDNGLLTAREVALNRSLPLDLVVLSACQTGLGKISGDGMLGLSRAFLIAGARTVVVSQWSVSDTATVALMVAFYQAYSEHGQKAIALQHAMKTVRAIPEYAHPRFWSAFVAVGAEN